MGVNQPRVYLDSCIIIYVVEEHQVYAPLIEAHLQNSSGVAPGFSPLSEMECLVMPLRTQNQALLAKFRKWFAQADYLLLERGPCFIMPEKRLRRLRSATGTKR